MTLTRDELKRLAIPLILALALLAAGIALIWVANDSRRVAQAQFGKVQAERQRNSERLARIAEEEREVKEKIEVYKQLKQQNILGEEKRLEWADAMTRIRNQRELLDLRYRVERQKPLGSVAGKAASVDVYGSTMKVNLALLHEEDLLRFLSDLRNSGNAYYSVQRCAVSRVGQSGATGASIVPRLLADCEIELVTIVDRAAKK